MGIDSIKTTRPISNGDFYRLLFTFTSSLFELESLQTSFLEMYKGKTLLTYNVGIFCKVTTAWLFYSEKGYISFLYVRPEFRRKGYAEKLIDSVLEKIPELKCHVEITNTSMLNLLRSKYEVISEEPAVSRTGKELIRFVWRKKNVEITK